MTTQLTAPTARKSASKLEAGDVIRKGSARMDLMRIEHVGAAVDGWRQVTGTLVTGRTGEATTTSISTRGTVNVWH